MSSFYSRLYGISAQDLHLLSIFCTFFLFSPPCNGGVTRFHPRGKFSISKWESQRPHYEKKKTQPFVPYMVSILQGAPQSSTETILAASWSDTAITTDDDDMQHKLPYLALFMSFQSLSYAHKMVIRVWGCEPKVCPTLSF